MALGLDRPERSFSWWIEARYDGTTTPDKELTRQIVRDMWMRYGHYQLNRTTRTDADLISSREEGLNGRFVRASRGFSGYLLQSTSNALPPGRIIVGVELDPYEFSQSPGYLEIAHRPSNRVLAKKPLPAGLREEGSSSKVTSRKRSFRPTSICMFRQMVRLPPGWHSSSVLRCGMGNCGICPSWSCRLMQSRFDAYFPRGNLGRCHPFAGDSK